MSEIVKKCYGKLFEDILSGRKNFDVRLGDFECKEGDILILKEIDENREFTGREIRKEVKYVLKTKELGYFSEEDIEKFGFQVISFD